MTDAVTPWPNEIRLSKTRDVLSIIFDNGIVKSFGAAWLRAHSPAADNKDKKSNPSVKITDIQSVGNYAVRLIFDDGHKTGIYSWDYFYSKTADNLP